MELEVINDSLLSGVIPNYYTKNRFDHTRISGSINWTDSIININEDEEISHNINTKMFELCLGKMRLKLSIEGGSYRLKGEWKDKDTKMFHCPTLSIWFEKQFQDTIKKISTSNLLTLRTTDVQKVIEITQEETDSVKCAFYDNGIIDDDTASVFFNDSLIIGKQRLSEHPIEFYISFDKTKLLQKLKLVADNLGSIPPNTALLIITTRRNRYEITLSSDFSKNGAVEFFLKE